MLCLPWLAIAGLLVPNRSPIRGITMVATAERKSCDYLVVGAGATGMSFVDTLQKCVESHQTLATELEAKILRKLNEFAQCVLRHPDYRDDELCGDFIPLVMFIPDDGFGLQWQIGVDNPMVRKLRTAIENGAKAEGD